MMGRYPVNECMTRAFAFLLIGLVFGGALGFVLAPDTSVSEQAAPAMDHAAHAHVHGEALMLDAGNTAPTLTLDVAPDPVAGWNVNIRTSNFTFAPERAGQDHVAGEGHAHIYVNGEKVARVYGDWFHLDSLPSGTVEIEVTLTSNDHRALVVEDRPLSASVRFENPS